MTTAQSVTGTVPEFSVHDRLRKAREHSGLSQLELAEAMAVSRNTVSNYESGAVTNLRKLVLNAWALSTGVPVEWLRTGKTDPPSDDPNGGDGCAIRDLNPEPADSQSSQTVTAGHQMHPSRTYHRTDPHTDEPLRHLPAA